MREIKFRAWDEKSKTMGEVNMIGGYADYSTYTVYGHPSGVVTIDDENPGNALMQFTGLTDKNGVDIYEGDILESQKNCLFDEGTTRRAVEFKDGGFFCGVQILTIVESFKPVVIGNIHENPELLEAS